MKENSTHTHYTLHNTWSSPVLVDTIVKADSIELIYTQYNLINLSTSEPFRKAFKIIFSCKDGKWHKSEPIEGTVTPPQTETYAFI